MFDLYHKWLGIAPKDQPPNNYRLLALDLFESDPEVIDAAANRQMAYLQQRATGQYAALSQKLMNEIAAARLCLLNPQAKAGYDAQLRQGRTTEQSTTGDTSVEDVGGIPGTLPSVPLPLEDFEPSPAIVRSPGRPVRRLFSPSRWRRLKPWHWAVGVGSALLLCMGVLALLPSGKEAQTTKVAAQTESPVADLESKIAKWQANRDKLKSLLEQLRKDKAIVLEKLDQSGVGSEGDPGKNPKGEVLRNELNDILRDTAVYEKKYKDYDLAILKSESQLRSIARRLAAQDAGMSDAELQELTRSMIILDESLSADKDLNLTFDAKDAVQKEMARCREGRDAAAPPSQPEASSGKEQDSPKPVAGSSDRKPSDWTPPVYRLTISPLSADLEVQGCKATVIGSGRERRIRVDEPPNGFVRLVLENDGYETKTQWIRPVSGKDEDISISLNEKAVRSVSKAPDETSRADGKATDGPIPGFHGITLYDKATGVGFFTYSFSDPSEKDDFDFENTVGANVSDGWLRLSGPNQRADHKAHFRTVHMKGEADCSLNQQPIMDLVEVPGVAGQLWPDRRSFGIYVAKGKGQDSIPIPGWNPKSVSFTFDVRENEFSFSVNGKNVRGQGQTKGNVHVVLRSWKGVISYRKLKIEGVLDPTWIEKNLSGR